MFAELLIQLKLLGGIAVAWTTPLFAALIPTHEFSYFQKRRVCISSGYPHTACQLQLSWLLPMYHLQNMFKSKYLEFQSLILVGFPIISEARVIMTKLGRIKSQRKASQGIFATSMFTILVVG